MNEMDKVISKLYDLRQFADTEIHPIVSPDNWDVYSKLCDLIDLTKADALALLKEQEAVVRCKDCKYYDYHNGCMSWHDVNSKNDNWYCADGERR